MIDYTTTNKEMISSLADKYKTGHHSILFVGNDKAVEDIQVLLALELQSQKVGRFKGDVDAGFLSMKDSVDGTCVDMLNSNFETIKEANDYIWLQCILNNAVTTNSDGTMKQNAIDAIVEVGYDGKINQVMYYL